MSTKKIILLFILWVVIINLFAVFALNRFNLESDTAYSWLNESHFSKVQQWNPVPLHSRWDSFWYLDIAQNGYIFKGSGQLSNIVFFPLYPILMRIVSFFLDGNFILAGWILSMIFLFLALLYFSKIVKEFHKEINPQLPLLFLLIFPTAFFLNTIYAESLFLFLSLASFYYALKKNFVLAGIFGLFSALARITGILLFIPLMWEYFQDLKPRHFLNKNFFSIFLVPFGTFIFFIFHYFKFGDLFLFLKIESAWGRTFSFNASHFSLFSHPAIVNLFIDILFVIFAIVTTYFVFKKLRVSYGLYMLATLFVALSTGTFMSIGRYILVLFPIYILMASLKNQYQQLVFAFPSVLLLAMNIILFVNNYWAG